MSEWFSGTGFFGQPILLFPRLMPGVGLLLTLSLLTACGGGTTKLPTSTLNTADSGAGSLREALSNAADGATLQLASGTVSLASPLKISKSVTLDLGSAVIDAGGKGRALEVGSGITVTIKGGTLKGGVGAPITVQRLGQQELSTATYGGVILNTGSLILDGTTVSGGKAGLGGGIANLKAAILTLKGNSKINSNVASSSNTTDGNGGGGGIYNEGTFNLQGGSIMTNSATYAGGGVYTNELGTMTISGGSIDNNECTSSLAATPSGNIGGLGGGIYTEGGLSMSGGTVNGNATTSEGGGIYVSQAAPFVLSGGEVSGNTTFSVGGGIAIGSGSIMTLSGGSVLNNTVTATTNAGGGGIFAYKAVLKMSGGTIKGNSARSGGGIDAFTDNTVEISGGTIEDNATTADGGGINVNTRSTLKFTGGTIQNNTAQGAGGGIVISSADGVLIMSDSATVKGNQAQDGGGVAVYSAKLNLNGGSIQNNQASRTGGGLLDGGIVTMTGGEISGNSVPGSIGEGEGGGGVRLFAGSTFVASGGSINNNTATFGGGVRTDEIYQTSPASVFTLAGATISGNTATDNRGGGVYNRGKLIIQSGSVNENTAKTQGGGVFNAKVAVYVKAGGSVTGNTPDNEFNEP